MLTTLSAFGSVIVLSEKERDAENMAAYRGLFWRRPWLAMVFTAALLSLAGIPLTVGFIGKIYVLMVGVESALWPLIFLLGFGSTLGLFYYLRLVVAMYGSLPEAADVHVTRPAPSLSFATILMLTVLTLG